MNRESQCPFHTGARTTPAARPNAHWWPQQLDLSILHQHQRASSPMDADFDYAQAFGQLDYAALKRDLAALMTDNRVRHVPVLVDGRLAGIVSIGDVVKSRMQEMAAEHQQLQAYITQGG